MMWPQQIPTFPPLPETAAHPALEPVATCAPLRPLGGQPEARNQSSGTQDCVEAWMQQPVVTCLPEFNLGELMELLSVHHISGAPVVDDEGNLLGVVSQTDVAGYLGGLYGEQARSAHGYHQGRLAYFNAFDPEVDHLLRQRTVQEIYSSTVHWVAPEASLQEVMDLMLREHVHRLPVLREGRLVGLISTLDVLRILRATYGRDPGRRPG